MANEVTVTETEFETRKNVANLTVRLSNYHDYQLRVITDSIGNVYVWVDHREPFTNWKKIAEFINGEERIVG